MSDLKDLNITRLKSFDVEFVSCHISKELALQISLNCVNNGSATGAEILLLWVEKLLHAYRIEDLSDDDWRNLIKCWSTSLFTVAESESELESNADNALALFGHMESLLRGSSEIVDLVGKCKFSNLITVCLQLEFVINTLHKFYEFHRNYNNAFDLKRHTQLGMALHNHLISVLCETVDNLPIRTQEECKGLTQLVGLLCGCVEKNRSVDFKTIVETWKCVTKLTVLSQKWLSTNIKYELAKNYHWTEKPIILLLQEVEHNINMVYRKGTLDQPLEQVEKYLRVTSFYLKLLIQMVSIVQHTLFPAVEQFFHLLKLSMCLPEYLQHGKVAEFVTKYVQNNLNRMCMMIYKHPTFKQMLWSNVKENLVSRFDLIQLYLNISISERDIHFCDDNTTFFTELFNKLLKEKLLAQPSVFEAIMDKFAALTLINSTLAMRYFFKRQILSGNLVMSYASMEVLLIVYSYLAMNKTQTKVLLKEFSFWHRCNECFAHFSSNPRRLNVQYLLAHLWNLCKQCRQVLNCELKNQFYCSGKPEQNGYSLYSWKANSCDALAFKAYECQLFELLTKCESKADSENYYRTVYYMEMLVILKIEIRIELIQKILELLLRACSLSSAKSRICFGVLLTKGFDLMTFYQSTNAVADSTLMDLINYVQNYLLQDDMNISKVPLIHFLSVCCRQENSVLHESAKNVLEKRKASLSPGIIQIVLMESSSQFNRNSLSTDIYERIISRDNVCLICEESNTLAVPQHSSKRARLDTNDDNFFGDMINDALKISYRCVEYASYLQKENVNILRKVIQNIDKAIENAKLVKN